MTPEVLNRDPAFSAMTMTILNNVLAQADNPAQLVRYLTDELRELTGARCVLFIQYLAKRSKVFHRVVEVNPRRCGVWAESSGAQRLYRIMYALDACQLWHGGSACEAGQLLEEGGFGLSIAVPLNVGESRVGGMLLLHLPDERHIETEMELLSTLSTAVALVFRTSFLFENQERIIRARTRALAAGHAELRASEEKYKNLIEHLDRDYFFYRHDQRGTFTYLSPSAADLLGYTTKELQSDYIGRFTSNSINREALRLRELGLKGERQPPYQVEIRHKDGSTRWLELTERPIFDDSGTVSAVEGIAHDISERKNAELLLHQSEERFRLAIVNAPFPMIIHAEDGQVVQINAAWTEITGYELAEIPTIEEWTLKAYGTRHQPVRDYLAGLYGIGKRVDDGEYEITTKSGERRVWDFSSAPLGRLPDGRRLLISMAKDVTDRKRTEDEYRVVIRTSKDGFWLVDLEGRILDVNDAYCEMSGYSRGELMTMRISQIDVDEGDAEVARQGEKVMLDGFARFERKHLCKSGSILDMEISASYLKHRDCFCAFLRNVTERKQLEEQLRQAQKMEAVGQLAGGVAHDFNNVLMVILGYGNILKMGENLAPEQKEKIGHILSAAEKAAQLTRGLLAFSRKQVMVPKAASLNEVVTNVQNFLVRTIGEDIELKLLLHDGKLPVVVDIGQIEQVIINLATNARDAMVKGGTLTIETGIQELDALWEHESGYGKPGRYAFVAVTDTGIGMDAETCRRIFEPFFSTKEVGKGTGLGMAIVYGIIRQHNGFINVYSEPGHGSIFRIYLPLAQAQHAPPKEKEAQPMPQRGSETILLAEDDAAVRKLVVSVLTTFGYEVIQAEDGQEAVEKFAEHRERIRLILMDMIMPRKNGQEAYDEISALQPGVKVIYSSGYTSDFIKNRGLSQEGINLIMKPVHPLELLRKVRDMLDA